MHVARVRSNPWEVAGRLYPRHMQRMGTARRRRMRWVAEQLADGLDVIDKKNLRLPIHTGFGRQSTALLVSEPKFEFQRDHRNSR